MRGDPAAAGAMAAVVVADFLLPVVFPTMRPTSSSSPTSGLRRGRRRRADGSCAAGLGIISAPMIPVSERAAVRNVFCSYHTGFLMETFFLLN